MSVVLSQDVRAPEIPGVEVAPIMQANLSRVVELHIDAFPGYLNVRMGRSYLEQFFKWFASDSMSIALQASLGRTPVGYAVGAPVDYARKLSQRLWLVGARSLLTRPTLWLDRQVRSKICHRINAMFARSTPVALPTPVLPAPVLSLVGIGVAPEYRGRQVGALLLAAFEQAARRRGAASYRLSVWNHNAQACRFYERHGLVAFDPGLDCGFTYYWKRLNVR